VFQIAAVPFDEFDALDVPDGPRWLLVRLARYADREGQCFPSMRTLAAGARKSLATICRWLKQLYDKGCFTRSREKGRVYRYTLAEPYRLRWRERPKPNTVHFTITMATVKSIRIMGCDARGRSG